MKRSIYEDQISRKFLFNKLINRDSLELIDSKMCSFVIDAFEYLLNGVQNDLKL